MTGENTKQVDSVVPPDDTSRKLVLTQADRATPHLGVVGDTYTLLLTGRETAGQFCLIDMHIPPGGGPPPHRHDFEETFIVQEGVLTATFRGEKSEVKAGETVHVPANAPHQFTNAGDAPVRLLCLCAPAGQEDFFREIGVPVATRTTPPPKLDENGQAELRAKSESLAAKYKTEFLNEA